MYPKLDSWYGQIPERAETFDNLPRVVQTDLMAWFNSIILNEEDKQLLLDLYLEGKFLAWNCPECGERVYAGDPDSYNNFFS